MPEVIDELSEVCCDCKTVLPMKILRSAAGYYLGHFCPHCGPYDRVSFCYYATEKEAEAALQQEIEWANKAP